MQAFCHFRVDFRISILLFKVAYLFIRLNQTPISSYLIDSLISLVNLFIYIEIVCRLWNCSKLLIRGSKMFSQRNNQQLHQITTHKCGHLTIFQVILTIREYKLYHDIHHVYIHNVSTLTAENKFHNFITYFPRILVQPGHWSVQFLRMIYTV